MGAEGVLGVVEEGAGGFAGEVAEGLQVLVLALAMRKYKQITRHLHMRQLTSRITKVYIGAIDQIHPLRRIRQCLRYQHRVFDYTMAHLEEYQSAAYRIGKHVGCLEGSNEAIVVDLGFGEVVGQGI